MANNNGFSLEKNLKGMYDSSPEAMGFADIEGNLMDVNDAFSKLTGYSKEELLGGKKYQNLTAPEYTDMEAKNVAQLMDTAQPQVYKKEYIRKDGSRLPVLATIFIVQDDDRNPIGTAAIIKDITDEKKSAAILEGKLEEMERMNKLMTGRELKMVELKEELEDLKNND